MIAKEFVCLPTLFCRPEKQNRDSAKVESEEVRNKMNDLEIKEYFYLNY